MSLPFLPLAPTPTDATDAAHDPSSSVVVEYHGSGVSIGKRQIDRDIIRQLPRGTNIHVLICSIKQKMIILDER